MSIIDAEKMRAELIRSAEYNIESCAKNLVNAKIDADFNPNHDNLHYVKHCVTRLSEAENRLKVLSEMSSENWQAKKPAILAISAAQ